MRLFVAVDPPPAARAELAANLDDAHAAAPPGLRWTAPEQWHLTLAFLGEVPDDSAEDLTDRLASACTGGPLNLRLAGGGHFRDRVLWAGVAGDTYRLRTLAHAVREAARAGGVAIDEEPYRPHLTVARAGRDRVSLGGAAAALAGHVGDSWPVGGVHLMRSRLGAGQAEHSVLATFGLGDPGAEPARGR